MHTHLYTRFRTIHNIESPLISFNMLQTNPFLIIHPPSIKRKLIPGKHAVFFVKRDLSSLLKGGQIFFAHVEKVLEDENSFTDVCLILNDNRPPDWESEKLFIVALHRDKMLYHLGIRCSGGSDERFGLV